MVSRKKVSPINSLRGLLKRRGYAYMFKNHSEFMKLYGVQKVEKVKGLDKEIRELPLHERGIVLPEDWMIQKHSHFFNLEKSITKRWEEHTWLSDIREEKPKKDIGFNFKI